MTLWSSPGRWLEPCGTGLSACWQGCLAPQLAPSGSCTSLRCATRAGNQLSNELPGRHQKNSLPF